MFGTPDKRQIGAVFDDFHRIRVLIENPPLTDICNPLYSDEWHSKIEQRIANIETFIESLRKLLP